MIPTKKITELWHPSLAGRHRPLCNNPIKGWRAGRNLGEGGTQREDFFNQGQNSDLEALNISVTRKAY
jgi:hypothetical protein